jgi:hypothetical protein
MGTLHRRSQTTKKTSLTQKHPDRLANLGGLRLRLRRRLHRRRSRNPSRPPRRRAPNRRLRAWLLRHRAPDLLSRHSRHLLHLRLLRRNLGLPARHQRNARAPRLPQVPLPLHGDRHRVLHVVLASGVPLLWAVGGGAFARVGGVDDQDYCVWGWVHWVVGFGVLVLARRGEVRFCADSEEFGAPAVRHVGALGHLARLHDWAGGDCVHPRAGHSDLQLLAQFDGLALLRSDCAVVAWLAVVLRQHGVEAGESEAAGCVLDHGCDDPAWDVYLCGRDLWSGGADQGGLC